MNEGGWIGVISIAVTGVLGLLTLVVKSRHDDKITTLTNQNAIQATQIATLTKDQEECKKESAECKESREKDRAALAAATRTLAARDERDKAELQRQIDDKQKQIDELKKRPN